MSHFTTFRAIATGCGGAAAFNAAFGVSCRLALVPATPLQTPSPQPWSLARGLAARRSPRPSGCPSAPGRIVPGRSVAAAVASQPRRARHVTLPTVVIVGRRDSLDGTPATTTAQNTAANPITLRQ